MWARHARPCCDNMATVHVVNAMVSENRSILREPRLVKRTLDRSRFLTATKRILAVAKNNAEGLSRRLSPGDLRVESRLRRFLQDGARAPADAFCYRPLEKTSQYQRKKTTAKLAPPRNPDEGRIPRPPVDMTQLVLDEPAETGFPAMLLVSRWPRQRWYRPALQIARGTASKARLREKQRPKS